jgi:hypothetical protein
VHPVALVVVHRRQRRVDRDLVEVRAAQARDLRVQVGVDAPCQQRVVAEVDARHDVRGAEGHLLGLGEEVVRVAVEHHAADGRDRHQLLGDQLGGVEHVEAEASACASVKICRPAPTRGIRRPRSLPRGRGGGSRGRRRRSSPPRPRPANGCRARLPVELDEVRLAQRVDQPEGVTPKPCIMRSCAGWPRSDITHISMCVVSGISEMKSQKVSCALAPAACRCAARA